MAMAIWLFLPTSPKPPGGSVGPRPDQLEEITHSYAFSKVLDIPKPQYTKGGFILWLSKTQNRFALANRCGNLQTYGSYIFLHEGKSQKSNCSYFLETCFQCKTLDGYMDGLETGSQVLKPTNPVSQPPPVSKGFGLPPIAWRLAPWHLSAPLF